ncbi:MAG TPA: TetR/AcrR family transcriptional regulator [Actinoplanes sp.]|jgi:AcrR family transcriptional regulator|nr:TetR/AcrR family transcriptional regulator [Actinoplanes sp.]
MAPRPAGTDGRRADARRNIDAILAAAQQCLIENPDVTIAEIAKTAGVGRVTLYGHFPTRADLLDAVFRRVSEEANAVLDTIETDGEPAVALTRLIAESWQIVNQFRAVLAAAEQELPPERIRSHHDRHLARLAALIRRGRQAGVFRTDLPEQWLVTVAYTLMHAAAAETTAGNLTEADAQRAVLATVLAAYRPAADYSDGNGR